jgi:hypothetical protein
MAPPRPAATVDPLLDQFFALGGALHAAGRMPVSLRRRHLAGWDVVGRCAAPRVLVGASVLPFRPLRGVLLLVERWPVATGDASVGPVAPDDLLGVAGVAGFWHLRGAAERHRRLQDAADLDLWIVHLDDDPVEVAGRVAPVLADRWAGHDVEPQLAAPFHVVVPWAWDRALPDRDPEPAT